MPDPDTHKHALDYCREKAGDPLSDFGLSRLFAPEELRDELVALHALYNELMNVAYTVSDPGVARAKLGWWQEEIGRAFEGRARHPALQALAGPIGEKRLEQDDLLPMVGGALPNVDPETPPTRKLCSSSWTAPAPPAPVRKPSWPARARRPGRPPPNWAALPP